jgi:hypothetical protein
MAKYEFDPKKFEEWKKAQETAYELQKKMNSSMGEYLKKVKELGELQKSILHIEQQINKFKQEQSDFESKKKSNEKEIARLRRSGVSASSDEVKNLIKQNKELKELIAARAKNVGLLEIELEYIQKQTDELAKQVKSVNTLGLGFKSIVGALGQTPGLIKKGFGMLKGTGIFEMDKEIRNAVRSMAGGKSTYNMMYGTITKAAESTTMWGVGVKDLAIMQRGYSEAIGRSVMLTEEGYKSMAKLAEGTGLGKEFAVEMAGAMDNFNISAERTSDIVENTMNRAARMGVNGAAAIKSLQKNLALAQRFNFKGGILGLSKLATEANKLKLDMEGIAGMAEKVFRPEGAIEMAAELTTMGGKFAALGDPMQLMFKARNDFAGFSKDIGKATAEFVQMDKKTGEFNVTNGLAADRMREISKITGIAVEKLQEMASAEARIQEIRKNTSGRFAEKDVEIIESMSKFDKKSGQWVININGQDKLIKDLRNTDLENIRKQSEALDKRAEEARTFDETLTDLILQFKQLLLPFAKSLKESLGGPIQELSKKWTAEGFYESLRKFVTGIAELVPLLIDFVKNNPITAALVGGAALFGGIIGKAALWFANGISLGLGFRSVAGMGGVPGATTAGIGASLFGQAAGASLGGAATSVGAIGAGLVAGGVAGYNEYAENKKMGMSGGENATRTLSKGVTAGIGGWGGAAAGAAIGTALFPVVGTLIGGIIGGIAGGYGGSALGEGIGDAIYGDESRNVKKASKAGVVKMDDGIIFHPQDKFLKVNDSMMLASTQKGQLHKAATELTGGGNSSSQVNHSFTELGVKIKVDAPGDSKFWESIVRQPEIMNMITSAVNETAEKNRSGGKPNGSGTKEKRRK